MVEQRRLRRSMLRAECSGGKRLNKHPTFIIPSKQLPLALLTRTSFCRQRRSFSPSFSISEFNSAPSSTVALVM
jgi:hypothetical protein